MDVASSFWIQTGECTWGRTWVSLDGKCFVTASLTKHMINIHPDSSMRPYSCELRLNGMHAVDLYLRDLDEPGIRRKANRAALDIISKYLKKTEGGVIIWTAEKLRTFLESICGQSSSKSASGSLERGSSASTAPRRLTAYVKPRPQASSSR